jgi:hypothetical protein
MRKDSFFISYTRNDLAWAEWIAFQLEAAGCKTILQAWDFRPGSNFVLQMHEALREAERVVAVLSPEYLSKPFPQAEWAAVIAEDPIGKGHRLVPVRVVDCDPEGLIHGLVYIDLVELDENSARERLLAGIKTQRAKPLSVRFPGVDDRPKGSAPRFPGVKAMTVSVRLGSGEVLKMPQILSNGSGISFVLAAGGKGVVGHPAFPEDGRVLETDLSPFYLSIYTITNRDFYLFTRDSLERYASIGTNFGEGFLRHWQSKRPQREFMDHPVTYVSWEAAVCFCDWLNCNESRSSPASFSRCSPVRSSHFSLTA